MTQINFRLPADFSGAGPIVDVWVDEVRSDSVRIYETAANTGSTK